MAKRNLTPESIVYVSSWGWRDCDISGSVVATTYKQAERFAKKGMQTDAKFAYVSDDGSQFKTIRQALAGIAWYGVNAFSLKDVCRERDLEGAIEALNDFGIWLERN